MTHIQHVTDDTFEPEVLQVRHPGAGGLLGRMVRPVQDDRADPRRGRQGVRGRLKIAKLNIDENQRRRPSSASAASRP